MEKYVNFDFNIIIINIFFVMINKCCFYWLHVFEFLSLYFFILLNSIINNKRPKLRNLTKEKLCLWEELNLHLFFHQGIQYLRKSVSLSVQAYNQPNRESFVLPILIKVGFSHWVLFKSVSFNFFPKLQTREIIWKAPVKVDYVSNSFCYFCLDL